MSTVSIPFQLTDWNNVPAVTYPGETGTAHWRSIQLGDLRVRVVVYSPDYLADHWCQKGHILYVVDGELETQLADGRSFTLKAGMSYEVSDDRSSHRSSTRTGATLYVVDGGFLKSGNSQPPATVSL